MLRIPAPEILANLRIGPLPETGEIVGHLLRAVIGAEEMKEHGDTAPGDPRCLPHTEQLLDPHG